MKHNRTEKNPVLATKVTKKKERGFIDIYVSDDDVISKEQVLW